ncbi:RDD family protein [Nocardioides coralli]|uniref:RDD family protein n=1 Tax=Nocardioides coralli TaxID=2872154 RepID=UPI001CA3A868|nr:RDD family protein [Nocardioides coralli]QZY28662.1 RDD family protein [Nocardioides coralli]
MSTHARSEADPTHPPAGTDRRFYAFVLDRLWAWPLLALVGYAGWLVSWRHGGLWGGLVLIVLGVLLVVAATAVGVGLWGLTPGKALLGLRVVDAATGRPIGVPAALLRGLVLAGAALPTFGIGLATLAQTAVSDPHGRRRGWHDVLTGSVVVDVRPVPEPAEVVEELPRPVLNLTAMRLAPAPAGQGAVAPGRRAAGAHPGADEASAPVGVIPVPRWRVTLDSGESLAVEGLLLLGRRPEGRPDEPVGRPVALTSHDLSVSKTHAAIAVAPDGSLVVTDRGSRNGTVLIRAGSSRQLLADDPATLQAGDTVRLGDRTLTVQREA